MFDWDDLRVFIAAARATTLAGAGQRLSIDAATVGRRIARLESALKSTLLVRSPHGLALTAAGAALLQHGLEAESAMEAAAKVAHSDHITGTVRISAAEGFGTAILAPALPDLATHRPGLRIELAALAGFLSASRREVDMAITLSAPNPHRLVIEPLTRYQLALYAAPAYLARADEPTTVEALRGASIVGYVDDLIYAPELRYLDEILPSLSPTLASSSIQAQRAIIRAGGGIGVLPCFLADGLVPILPGEILMERRFWLGTHREVHETARIRSVRSWLRDLVAAKASYLAPF